MIDRVSSTQSEPNLRAGGARSPVLDRILAFGVHAFTASGAVVGAFALIAARIDRLDAAAFLMLVALLIDGLDGTLARAVDVERHTPEIDGRRLDDMVDFLNFVIVPIVFLQAAALVSHPGWLAAPVLASAYGFSRRDAKTEDGFFLGFPSYWNILAIYLWLLGTSPAVVTFWLVLLSVGVFVPYKFLYPSKVEPRRLRVALGIGAVLWLGLLVIAIDRPELARRTHLVEASLFYPVWYLALSAIRGGFAREC